MLTLHVFNDFLAEMSSLDVSPANAIVRLIVSAVLGSIVGAERKHKGQIAGIRTFALISMGACMAMLLSIYVPQVYLGLKNGDPGRIAAQVITGIGFLGGGAMIQQKGAVRGLTTAAGIWITAIIGMAVGVGMYFSALGATALILCVLMGFEWYEHSRRVGQENKVINIKIKGIVDDITPYRRVLARNDVHLSMYYIEQNYERDTTELNMVVLVHTRSDLLPVLKQLREVTPTRSINLSSQVDI
ncbi:MAG: MgtC/SapB family protein [Muribaculaceae bacterium]|nr:MgtC/SapB family protein [Muribaculaceae bacterium]